MVKKDFIVNCDTNISKFLIDKGFNYSYVQKMLKNKDILVNSKRVKANIFLHYGDVVEVYYKEENIKEVKIDIAYQDENIIIAVKPIKIKSCGEDSLETLLNAKAVHRLDTNTQGLIILAKSDEIKRKLISIFKQGLVEKRYLCEVLGPTNFNNSIENAFLFKDSSKSRVIISSKKDKGYVPISTIFTTIKSSNQTSVLDCELLSGKTHQIRAHLSFLGHPILGDSKYGNKQINRKLKERYQKLFCYKIKFKNILEKELSYLSYKEFVHYPPWFNF